MIEATFYRKKFDYTGFSVKGHAYFAPHGEDIVCAAVTSAVQMTANTITDVVGQSASVSVSENEIIITEFVPSRTINIIIEGLKLHLKTIKEDYPETIKINTMEE